MGTFPLDQSPPTLMALARTLPDAKGREAAFLAYGKPSGTACISAAALEYLSNLGRLRSYDLVHVCRLWMAEAGLAAANPRSRLTLDLDEDDYASSESIAQLWSSRGWDHASRMRRLEAATSDRMLRSVAPRFERLWISNRDDAATLTARHKDFNIEVVPNAVEIPEQPRRRDDGRTLLFVGSFNYEPNVEGVLWFVSSVWPRLLKRSTRPVRFVIAGPNPPPSIRALARPSLFVSLAGRERRNRSAGLGPGTPPAL